ncbi:pirin family protein [Acidocella aminolytica]|uniref:pirin family protein n=1 Tax=Acidocella aminolytica TaxID=33998 RepID=UPI00278C5B21|nr:pirin family protein [Acidocella aminolytica]
MQVMHAGSGIVHSEVNPGDEPTRLFQIWILPDRENVTPGWGCVSFRARRGRGCRCWQMGASPTRTARRCPYMRMRRCSWPSSALARA